MVDLDGTLARTAEANLRAYASALAEFGIPITTQILEPLIGGRHWKQFLPAILAERQSTANPEAIAARKALIYAASLTSIELNTALIRLLISSRPRLKTALVTSASRVSVCALLEAHNLAHLFEAVITGDDVRAHNHDPEAYRLAAEKLQVQPEETLIYEDSDIGVASAKAFGGHVIRVLF